VDAFKYKQARKGGIAMDAGPLTLLMNVIGPVLLGIAIAAGIYWSRQRSATQRARTEAATRREYHELEDERRAKEGR
jgi:hypothetical protein